MLGEAPPRVPPTPPLLKDDLFAKTLQVCMLCVSASGAPMCAKAVVWEAVLYFYLGTQPATHPPQTESLSCDTEAFRTQCPVCVSQAEPGGPRQVKISIKGVVREAPFSWRLPNNTRATSIFRAAGGP